jgi:hypothetical protein
MAYNANIPQSADQISVSQADILGNFQAIDTFVAVDHIGFGIVDAGKHKTATFPQAAAPAAVGATEVGIYAAALGGAPELYINKTATQVPFTKSVQAAAGYTYLPSGMIMQWGTVNATHGGTYAGFTIAFPTACVNVHVTGIENGGVNDFVSVDTVTVAGFWAYSSTRSGGASTTNCYYFAIGY